MVKVVIKELTSNQNFLFAVSLSKKIPFYHPVRLVDQVVELLNIDCLLSKYKGGGSSSDHPRMMLKILFYSYLCNIFSCRKRAKAFEKNIYFMWLSGNITKSTSITKWEKKNK